MRRVWAFLAVMALTLSAQSPDHSPKKRVLITDFGALADGTTVNTKAIQSAIDKCAGSGGCTIVVPKGTFLSGAIFLKQGVNLSVEKDGVLKGTTNIDDYPIINTRWEGVEEPWTSAFVNADGLPIWRFPVKALSMVRAKSGCRRIHRAALRPGAAGGAAARSSSGTAARAAAADRHSEFEARARRRTESS